MTDIVFEIMVLLLYKSELGFFYMFSLWTFSLKLLKLVKHIREKIHVKNVFGLKLLGPAPLLFVW